MNKKKFVRLLGLVMALAMTFTMFSFGTSAAKATFTAPTSPMTVDENAITMAAHSQAWITPEVLGINNTTSRNTELSENFYVSGDYTTSSAIAALGVFGTDINDNPNPYMYNYFYNCYATANGLQLVDDYHKYMLCYSIGGSPMAAAVTPVAALGNVCASLYDRPDILLGVDSVTYNADGTLNTTGYTASIAALPENTDSDVTNDYNPYQVVYTSAHVYSFLQSMYELSDVCADITKDTGKTTRYSDPSIITSDMEKYVKGIQSYVISKIKADNQELPVVAIINIGETTQARADGDIASNEYLVDMKGYSLEPTTNFSRAAEYVADVSTNIVDALGTSNVKTLENYMKASNARNAGTVYAVTADQLANSADVIIFGDVMSSVPENSANATKVSEFIEDIIAKASSENKSKVSSIEVLGSAFDCVGSLGANSVENLLGMAYYTAYLYPQYINQFDVATYWYRNFYHITDNEKLKSIIAANFQDAAVQTAYKDTYTTDISRYNEASLEAKIIDGMNYYEANKSSFVNTLLYQNGRTGENTGWDIDWTKGIGSGNRNNVTVITPNNEQKVTATISEESKQTVTDAIINNFTPEELEQYNFGADLDVDVAIIPVEEKDISADTVKKISEAVKPGEKIGAYLNIDISYTLGNNSEVKVIDLGNEKIEITVSLPIELQNKATYVIYREHNGKVDAIIPTVSADGKSLTFESSKFSTYAIAYTEKSTETVANTADNTAIVSVISVTTVSVLGAAYVISARKKQNID